MSYCILNAKGADRPDPDNPHLDQEGEPFCSVCESASGCDKCLAWCESCGKDHHVRWIHPKAANE